MFPIVFQAIKDVFKASFLGIYKLISSLLLLVKLPAMVSLSSSNALYVEHLRDLKKSYYNLTVALKKTRIYY